MPSVLIVDDSLAIARKLQRALEASEKYSVAGTAIDGAEAIARYRELRPDVVLMDLVMPKMDGLTAIRMIRSFDPEANIIVLSSIAGMSDKVEEALRFGAKQVLAKPFSEEDVVRTLDQVTAGQGGA